MKNTLLLATLAATLPVQAVTFTQSYEYTYAQEGGSATMVWTGTIGHTGRSVVQVQEREITDTQGRPVKLQIRPVETQGHPQRPTWFWVEFKLEGLAPDAEVQWTGDFQFTRALMGNDNQFTLSETEKETVPATFTLKPRDGAAHTSTVAGDFRAVRFGFGRIGLGLFSHLDLEPATPEGRKAAAYHLPDPEWEPDTCFCAGLYSPDRLYVAFRCPPLNLDGTTLPMDATLPVDAVIPATTKDGASLQLHCKGTFPLPPEYVMASHEGEDADDEP